MCGGVDEDVSETCKSVRVNKGEYILKNKYYNLEKNGGKSYTLTLKQSPTLYQYRTINKYTTDALLNSEVFATVPASFNDPYDSSWCYDEKRIKKEIAKRIPNGEEEQYRNAITKDFENTIDGSFDLIETIFERLVIGSIKNHKEGICVSCYSERIDSEIMWAHYAGNATGFQVEYDGQQLKSLADDHRNRFVNVAKSVNLAGIDLSSYPEPDYVSLFPVIYTALKPNYESIFSKVIDPLFSYFEKCINGDDVMDATTAYLTTLIDGTHDDTLRDRTHTLLCSKQKTWSYEKEWRIWSYNMNPLIGQMLDKHVYLGKVKPLAICLGEYISKYDEIALVEIAKTILDIPVYKMKTQINRNSMKLVPYQIY